VTQPCNCPVQDLPITRTGERLDRIWWRFFHLMGQNINEIVATTTGTTSQNAAFESQIADQEERLRSLENAHQVFADLSDQISYLQKQLAALFGVVEGMRQAVDDARKLMPVAASSQSLGNLTISENGGLNFLGQTTDAGAATATLTNAPHAANPVFWLRAVINGVAVTSPWWAA
jgi:hypothetical protein